MFWVGDDPHPKGVLPPGFFYTFLSNMLLKILLLYIRYLGLKLGVEDQQPNNSYFIFQGLDVIVANKYYTIPRLGRK